jgi:hypothetical protein
MAAGPGYPSRVPAQTAERSTHRDPCQFALELLDEADAIVMRHSAGD